MGIKMSAVSVTDLENGPDWYSMPYSWVRSATETTTEPLVPDLDFKKGPLMQSDAFRPLYFDCLNYGFEYARQKYCLRDPHPVKYAKTSNPKKVIVVGAGPAGLSAARELAQVGHEVEIVELQQRVGGRVKTLTEPFEKGLWADSGAMRLPGDAYTKKDVPGKSHFLSDWYGNHFKLQRKPFMNQNPKHGKQLYYFYREKAITYEEWNKHPGEYCTMFWEGWDKELNQKKLKQKYKINDISSYYEATVKPVIDDLRSLLVEKPDLAWKKWVDRWSHYSLYSFLKSNDFKGSTTYPTLADLLPWPDEAIIAQTTFTYDAGFDLSITEWLREELGEWWKDPMYTFTEGLSMLPLAFTEKNSHGWNKDVDLSKKIHFGFEVRSVHHPDDETVKIVAYNRQTGKEREFIGNAVILTVPLNIMRQLDFNPILPQKYYKAMMNVNYAASTKIMLQCKTQFWEKKGIQGGFSHTDLPVRQIHYPSDSGFQSKEKRGILLVYTWKQEALLFGSQSEASAVKEAVEEISAIHPEIKDEFEVGAMQAWYSDHSAQGAFALLKPQEYKEIKFLMFKPYRNIYFAGEALSWCNGWIQGALESSLRAAYQFYKHNES